MNFSKKWRAIAAATIAVALIGSSAGVANAAVGDPLTPQPNGSPGSFYFYDSESAEYMPDVAEKVWGRFETAFVSAAPNNLEAEIYPTGIVPEGATWTQVFRFIAKAENLNKGTNGWDAYSNSAAAGPTGGVYQDNWTLGELSIGGNINKVFMDGGTYYAGLAFTDNNGVTVRGTIYRTVNIIPATNTYTIEPAVGPSGPKQVVEADLTPALQTLDITAPAEGSTVIEVNAGIANANKTFNIGAFSDLTDLGQITLDGTGAGSIDVAGKGLSLGTAHKLFLAESDGTIVAWNSFTLIQGANSDNTDITVDVNVSDRFEFIAPAATTVDLGGVQRDKTSAPVALGQFSVIDDRDQLLGWNLNVSSTAFTGPNNATIANTALGYAVKAAGGTQTGVTLGAVKQAGAGSFGVLVEGAPNATTTEGGAQFDADLTFKAPIDAVKGAYKATLTLDLVSK